MKNHIANNILTRGNMNISSLTKGFILPYFEYEIIKASGGSGSYKGTGYYELQRHLDEMRKNKEEVGVIKVKVDWYKNNKKYNKKIYAELIIKKIEAQLIEKFEKKFKITVELIDESNNLK